CVPDARLDVFGIQLQRAKKLTLGFRLVPNTHEGGDSQRTVRFRERGIPCHRSSSRVHGFWDGSLRSRESVPAKARVTVGKVSPRQRVVRIKLHCPLAAGKGSENGRPPPVEESVTLQVGLVRLQIRRSCLHQWFLTPWKRDLQTLDD